MTKQDCLDKLAHIAEYEPNWNGYGADPIDEDVLDCCRKIVDQVTIYPEIFLTANNSINLEHKTDKVYIEIKVFSDRYALFVSVGDKWSEVDLSSIKQAIQWWNILTAIV